MRTLLFLILFFSFSVFGQGIHKVKGPFFGSGGGGGDDLGNHIATQILNMSTFKITNVVNPTSAQDAATKDYVDTSVSAALPLAGGTMSGAIAMGTNKITGMGEPTALQDAATKNYVDSQVSGATTALDNLASVQLNSDLIFGPAVTGTIKTNNNGAGNSENLTIGTGTATGTRGGLILDALTTDIPEFGKYEISDLMPVSFSTQIPAFVIDGASTAAKAVFAGGILYNGTGNESIFLIATKDIPAGAAEFSADLVLMVGGDASTGGGVGAMQFIVNEHTGPSGNGGTMQFRVRESINGTSGFMEFNTDLGVKLRIRHGDSIGTIGECLISISAIGDANWDTCPTDDLGNHTATQALNMNTFLINNVVNPVSAQDAATKDYVDTADALKLALAGGTMSGAIAMGTSKITGMGEPTALQDAATKNYVDTADALKLALAGGTMSGAIAMGTSKITGLGEPTAAQDAATKNYVDTAGGGASTALDNLASVQINASLLFDAAATYDVGSDTDPAATMFTQDMSIKKAVVAPPPAAGQVSQFPWPNTPVLTQHSPEVPSEPSLKSIVPAAPPTEVPGTNKTEAPFPVPAVLLPPPKYKFGTGSALASPLLVVKIAQGPFKFSLKHSNTASVDVPSGVNAPDPPLILITVSTPTFFNLQVML